MRKLLRWTSAAVLIFGMQTVDAQTRYLDEVFDDSEITVQSDIIYATNIDFLTSDLTESAQLVTDIGTLSALADAGSPYPAAYFNPLDETTQLKVTNLEMDIYHPSDDVDDVEDRPLIIYLHTGNFLPPPVNGSMMGRKADSLAVDLCRSWAKRGYVCASINYRLGWNPIATTVQERTGTLLNAVYRALQDTKIAVRFLRDNEDAYDIDDSRITLFGEGSGGYVAQAYTTLDKPGTELFLEKFRPNPFDETVSYVDTLVVGTPDGIGFPNSLNLYRANGTTSEVHMSVNAGGALADESWLEAGDVPMVAFHAVRDDFAPFTAGTVIVPTTNEEVVEVDGSNVFIQKANDLGNNDVFAGLPDGDVYTDRARSLYGQSYDALGGGGTPITQTVNATPEGLFPILQPLQPYLTNISAPWQWWDPEAPLSQFDLGGGVTTHLAQLQSNPNMSEAQSQAYQDTISGYLLPRLTCALDLPGNPCQVIEACPFPDAIVCDNFDDYALGDADFLNADHWIPWPGGTVVSNVSNEQAFSNSQSLKVGPGGVEDQMFDTDNQTQGLWTIDWMMYVPANATAFFNIQAGEVAGDAFIYQAFMNQDGNQPGVGDFQQLTETFTYPEDEWFDVSITVDLNNDLHWLTIDGQDVLVEAPYVANAGPDPATVLNGINFYSIDANNTYYIDDIVFDGNPDVSVAEFDRNISFFPNPTSAELNISTDAPITGALVSDMLGKVVMNEAFTNNSMITLDLSSLDQGVYFVTIEVEGQRYTKRVVKD